MTKLLLLFIVIPTLELILLIELGWWIGTLPTLGLIVFTGALGMFLARRQGLYVLAQMQAELQAGQIPTNTIFDGVIILIAGALLMTPGILTDTAGFLCLIPATRRVIKRIILSRIERAIRDRQIITSATHSPPTPDNVIIIDPDDYEQKS